MKKVFFTLMMLVSIAFCQNENQSIRQIKPNYSKEFRQNRQKFGKPTIIGNKMDISIAQDGVIFMKKATLSLKNVLAYIYKYFPIIGGYSIKDADELMKDPDHYNYRGNSWLKKQSDKLANKQNKK